MERFSISQLSQFSGVKPHTIRIWEQRYNALRPGRSAGNTRYYNNDQLRRLLNIVSLQNKGYKISELCQMNDSDLGNLVMKVHEPAIWNQQYGYHIAQLISAGLHFDEMAFDKIFNHCLLSFGLKSTYAHIVSPLLLRIGLMWAADQIPPAQEHFMSNLIRQKILVAIDSLPPPGIQLPPTLLFLPENEFHEIPLLFAHYILREMGLPCLYLGANVPLESVKASVFHTNPDNILFFIIRHGHPENIAAYVESLRSGYKGRIYLAGNQTVLEKMPRLVSKNIKLLFSVEELEKNFMRFV